MKKMSLPAFLVAIVLAGPAFAEDTPIYALDDHCQGRWQANTRMKNVCIQQQQASYNALKALWASTPAEITQHCRGEWDKSNDYVMLQFCVEQQVQAVKNAAAAPPE